MKIRICEFERKTCIIYKDRYYCGHQPYGEYLNNLYDLWLRSYCQTFIAQKNHASLNEHTDSFNIAFDQKDQRVFAKYSGKEILVTFQLNLSKKVYRML